MRRIFTLFNVLALLALIAAIWAGGAASRPPEAQVAPQLATASLRPVNVGLFFVSAGGGLGREARELSVASEERAAVAQAALTAWAQGPREPGHAPPPFERTPALFLREGHYFVNLPGVPDDLGPAGEFGQLCALTRTLLDLGGSDVTFLVNGESVPALKHVATDEPFRAGDCP